MEYASAFMMRESAGPEAPEGVSVVLRAQVARWINLSIAIVCFGQAALLALNSTGVIKTLPGVEHAGRMAIACFIGGIVSVLARQRRTRAPRVNEALAVLLALIAGIGAPATYLEHAIPQSVWVSVLVAAATCDIVWIFVTAAVVHGLMLVRHPFSGAMTNPTAWVNSVVLVMLIAAVRWLHDTGLRHAERSHARMLAAMFTDDLTGLPNRHRFVGVLSAALNAADRAPLAVLRVDIEQFGATSDSLGRSAGDALLRRVAEALREALPEGTPLARVGADDFLALLVDTSPRDAEARAFAVADRFEAPIGGGDASGLRQPVRVALRIGVTTADAEARPDPESVLQRAEQAVALAQRAGRRRVAVLSSRGADNPIARFFQLSQDLHEALPRDELSVVYQPIFDLRTGALTKAEALVRWNHRTLGPVGPAEFIPIAESNGTIHRIGDWVFRQAAEQARRWRERGASDFQISVNRSPVQFRDDGDGLHPCLQELDAVGAPPNAIALEITEGVILDADTATWGRLEQLRRAGIALSLDDFGTGYSSIGQLHRLNLDVVKIDRAFVAGLERGSKSYVLCESIIRMSHSLGLKVVAEGIETAEQRELLTALECDFGQGYLFGRPMRPEQLETLLPSSPERESRRVGPQDAAAS